MGRKKGGKNSDTDLKAREILAKKLENPGKTQMEIAEELGIEHNTVSQRLKRAMELPEIKALETTSEENLIKMLPDCDKAYLDALRNYEPQNMSNRIKVATLIYKTRGLIKDNPVIVNNTNILEVVSVDGTTEALPV